MHAYVYFILVGRTSIKFQPSVDEKKYLHALVTYENWGNPYYPRCRVVVVRLIEMFALFELKVGWSDSYVHCTFCIALNLAPTTLQFKGSDLEIEYNKHKNWFPLRRKNKSRSLLHLFYKTTVENVHWNCFKHIFIHANISVNLIPTVRGFIKMMSWVSQTSPKNVFVTLKRFWCLLVYSK